VTVIPEPPVAETSKRTVETESLFKRYGGKTVVAGVSIRFSQGEVVGLLGPNGAGKTTTFYMTVGITQPDTGKILLDGNDITRLPMYLRARRGIGYLAQEPSVFKKLTALENILLVLELTGYPSNKRVQRANELLEELGIGHVAQTRAYKVSGGERRRIEIARALATNPAFILMEHRPDHSERHPGDHPRSDATQHRDSDHRPQRAGDARHLRPGLYPDRRQSRHERHRAGSR
jgi:ABC-type lipopolysaccharide export system ATPase subunit